VFVNSLLSLFYYLRWIAPVFQKPDQSDDFTLGGWSARTAIVAAAWSLGLGIAAGPLWDVLPTAPLR